MARESLIALVALIVGGAIAYGVLRVMGWKSADEARVMASNAAAASAATSAAASSGPSSADIAASQIAIKPLPSSVASPFFDSRPRALAAFSGI